MSNVGSGNVTVVVRGAHDGFDGVYRGTYSLSVFGGVDDTHRWMLVGYGQERPILDGDGEPNIIITHRNENLRDSYVTVQRLQIQNAEQSGIRLGWDVLGDKRGNCFNCIDIIGTNFELSAIYYLNADNGWIFHCTVGHTWGHGYKVGDGASDCTVDSWAETMERGLCTVRAGAPPSPSSFRATASPPAPPLPAPTTPPRARSHRYSTS